MAPSSHGPHTGPLLVFTTGGVMSTLGKGIACAALGALLKARGLTVQLRKLDPYLNVDCGTMSPYQHGEVFVTHDGAETDLDLGHYERFTQQACNRADSITTGRLYKEILEKERQGGYLGDTVQVIPHVTDAIKQAILKDTQKADITICEIGGTVGDIESLPFLEAIRQLRHELGASRTIFIHLAWLIYLPDLKELKTKPAQHSVKELQRAGIQPDILLCRSSTSISPEIRKKIALFCNVKAGNVIEAANQDHIYGVPAAYHEAGLDTQLCAHFNLTLPPPDLTPWQDVMHIIKTPHHTVDIAVVGKYTDLPDAYKSLLEALHHGGLPHHTQVNITCISGESLEQDTVTGLSHLEKYQGILVPGGYGQRGTEGMIHAITLARQQNIPFLGICFGMQLAVIETARHVAHMTGANSSELDPNTPYPVVALLEDWVKGDAVQAYKASLGLGGTMRLGSFPCALKSHSFLAKIYGTQHIAERHRHRYEVNEVYIPKLEAAGLLFSGTSPKGHLMECIERPDHPWFVGVQFHPEFSSRPFAPHPLFVSFVEAALGRQKHLMTG